MKYLFVCFFYDRIDRTDLEQIEYLLRRKSYLLLDWLQWQCRWHLFVRSIHSIKLISHAIDEKNLILRFVWTFRYCSFREKKEEELSLKDLLIDICDVRRVLIVCSMEKKHMRWHVPFEECLSWSKSRDFSLRRISLFRLIAMAWEWEMSKSFFRDNQSDIS